MKNTIKRIFYAGFILVLCLCLNPLGCKKKPPKPGEEYGWVEGNVKDVIDSTSIIGAEILAGSPPDTAFITKTDSTGYYKFPDFPGAREVTAKANGYESQTKTVVIIVDKTTRLDFFLNRK